MTLSDVTIKEYVAGGKIVILPEFRLSDVRPAGIRLHIGKEILVPSPDQTVDLAGTDEVRYERLKLTDAGYTLKPNAFILATTYERFQLPRDIVGYIDGRSTIARLGLAIHCTSAIVDGNFDEPRTVVLEIKNNGPFDIILKPKTAVAMLVLSQLSTPIAQNSQAQYRGQDSVAPPNLKVQKQ